MCIYYIYIASHFFIVDFVANFSVNKLITLMWDILHTKYLFCYFENFCAIYSTLHTSIETCKSNIAQSGNESGSSFD